MFPFAHARRGFGRIAGPVVLATLSLSTSAFADVSPSSVTATTNPGGSITVDKAVVTPAIPPRPDIVFLADTTGSMTDAIGNVHSGATSIMNTVRSAQPDAQFGAASYRDTAEYCADVYDFRLDQAVTATIADAQAGIDSWSADGGCDEPEGQLNALTRIATDAATGFRPGSSRIVVWFGDAPGQDPSAGATLASTISALQTADIRVIAISTGFDQLDAFGQASQIAAATGGLFRSGIDDGAVAAEILAALQNLPVTVSPQISCDPDLSVSLVATSAETITSGGTVTYTETITVDPASPGGVTLSCTVVFLLDGLAQDGFTETISVTVNGADLAIVKTGPALVTEGDDVVYTLAVTNNGPAPATGVTVTDVVPANTTFVSASAGCTEAGGVVTCAAGSLAAGATTAFTVTVRAGSAGSAITNTGTVAGDQFDPVAANNTSTALTVLNHDPVCSAVTAGPALWPPNHALVPVTLTGATDADGDPLSWTVTGVTQDEPTNGLGDGDTPIDAVLGTGPNLRLRAERSGHGNGRVYRIAFTVTDGRGGSCTGVARVGVPRDQSPSGRTPVDSGGVYNSLV